MLGETISFLMEPYAFVRKRFSKHGPLFRTHLFGRKTAVMVGPDSADHFIDPALVERCGSQPGPVYKLFAGPSLPHLDGAEHRTRKETILEAFSPEALTAYLPAMHLLVQVHLAEWAVRGEVAAVKSAKILALQAVAQDIMGITRKADLQQLEQWYTDIANGFTSLPIPFPGGGYARGLKAVGGVLQYFGQVVRQHRQTPGQDGLSRLLGSGLSLSDDQAAREMHHMVLAGRVVYAHLLTILFVLSSRAELQTRLEEELARVVGSQELTMEKLDTMPLLHDFVLEVKRTSPVVPGMFGKARASFDLHGYTVPQGWQIMFGLRQSLFDADIFSNPESFQPERFEPPRCEHLKHAHACVPHGPGQPRTSHHCAGTDYATLLAKVFVVTLLSGYRFELPPQNLEYKWSQLTPDFRDGLRTRLRARSEPPGP
jgi:cytochrome P450